METSTQEPKIHTIKHWIKITERRILPFKIRNSKVTNVKLKSMSHMPNVIFGKTKLKEKGMAAIGVVPKCELEMIATLKAMQISPMRKRKIRNVKVYTILSVFCRQKLGRILAVCLHFMCSFFYFR